MTAARRRAAVASDEGTAERRRHAEAQVGWLARQAMGTDGPVLERPVRLTVEVEMQQPLRLTKLERAAIDAGTKLPTKTPDIDNLLKTVLDGLNGVAFRDDAQVCEVRASKRYAPAPRTWVRVEVIEPEIVRSVDEALAVFS